MVVCMETWMLADRTALKRVFGACLREAALLPPKDLELRTKAEVHASLIAATRDCGRERMYAKGRRSFQIVGELDPTTLGSCLPHFTRFVSALGRHA
jgi:hypothetical protein